MKRFWKWVALFAYRRWVSVRRPSDLPTGIPGHRDPDAPCSAYAPRRRMLGDWRDCQGDGHYLCVGCAHLDPDSAYAEERKLEELDS